MKNPLREGDCNKPFSAFSNCRLPKGHEGHCAHTSIVITDAAEFEIGSRAIDLITGERFTITRKEASDSGLDP